MKLLAVGPPHGAERAVLRAAAHRLHRAPHVAPGGQQIPAARHERVAFDAAAIVLRAERPSDCVVQRLGPCTLAVAGDDRVRAAESVRLFRKERGVDAPEHDVRAGIPGGDADLVTAERVTSMDSDADDVPGRDDRRVEAFERLVDQQWRAERLWRGRCQDIQPARRDDADAERYVTRVDEIDVHRENTTTAHLRSRIGPSGQAIMRNPQLHGKLTAAPFTVPQPRRLRTMR